MLAICTKAAAQSSTCATFDGLVKAIAPSNRCDSALTLVDQDYSPALRSSCVLPGKKYNPGPETQLHPACELRRGWQAARRHPSSKVCSCVQPVSAHKWAGWR